MTNAIVRSTQANAGDYGLVSQDTTDERVVDMWLASGRRGNSPATQDVYRRTWREFAGHVNRPLQAVTLDVLQEWVSSLQGKPATRRTKLAAVRSLFSFCVRIGYLRLNPAAMLESPPVASNPRAHVVTVADLARVLDACQTPLECALLRALYSTGARVSEVLALRWRDVTPRDDGRGAHVYIADGKGHKQRTVGVTATAYAAMLALRDTDTPGDAYVFATRTGRHLDRHAAHRLFKRVLHRAGVKDADAASAHWLRHSHASHSIQQGANVADVRAQLGHASLDTTSLYVHAAAYSSDKLPL